MLDLVKTFLARHGFSSSVDTEAILASFLEEMHNGLVGKASSLAMLPAYVGLPKTLKQAHPVWVMDAGGTNLRVATVSFNDNSPLIEDFQSSAMPGTQQYLEAKDFYKSLASKLNQLTSKSNELGICFSYPAQILPNHDGKVLRLTKELHVKNVEGSLVAHSIGQALKEMSGKVANNSIVLNDTVADLLAGIALDRQNKYRSYVGFILGTGTNCAYMESSAAIKAVKLDGEHSVGPVMAVNIESGNFNRLAMSAFDLRLDQSSRAPGRQILEKMISGAYLGRLVFEILLQAGSEQVISDAAYQMLKQLGAIETKSLNVLLDPELDALALFPAFDAKDLAIAAGVAGAVLDRASALTAINIAAATISAAKSSSHDERPICIAADGSTFFKAYSFKERVQTHLHLILDSRGIQWQIVQLEDGPLLGAAVAALSLL